MDYGKIQEYKRNGLKKSQVARRLEVDYKTILKYWDMSPSEYAETAQASKKRRKKADEYKDFVVECLTKYPDMSAAQIYDWIKERARLETLDIQKRAFRNYVQEIRKEYGIKKPVSARDYEAVDELPMGQQAQVDMGEVKIETTTGRHRKVYCFAMVLAHSRYKFIWWQLNPFATDTFITAHMKAFEFYGGRPIALGYHACENGYRVSYTTMQSLMQVLRTCEIDRRSKAKMNRIHKSNLLVVDEVGYLPITSTEGNLFFQLISELQEQTSIIITTNKGFEEWAEFLDDAALATAILDRLSYRCDRIQMSGKSYRLENRKSFLNKGDLSYEI